MQSLRTAKNNSNEGIGRESLQELIYCTECFESVYDCDCEKKHK